MKFKFQFQVGQTNIEIEDEASTQREFFDRLSFWTSLPKTGPNGEDDLRFVSRTTSKGHVYYSIASPAAGKEMAMGIHNDTSGRLFPKDWQPINYGRNHYDELDQVEDNHASSAVPQRPRAVENRPVQTDKPEMSKMEKDYRTLCRAIKLAESTADDILDSCTREDGSVDWNRAKNEARKAIAA